MWNKQTETQVKEEIHEICISEIDEEYRVFLSSDDGGTHFVVWFEETIPEKAKKLLSSPFKGWRLLKVSCPDGYLNAYFPTSGMG